MRPLALLPSSSPAGTIYRAETPAPLTLFYTGADFDGRLDGDGAQRVSATIAEITGSAIALSSCHQVHGTRVASFKASSGWCELDSCDALWSDQRPSALAIKIADCLPVTLIDPGALVVANVHAGWRGAAAKIVEATLREVERHSFFAPARAWAFLGPSIRVCCFQVGEEVVEAFRNSFGDVEQFVDRSRGERPHLDLVGLNAWALEQLGLASGSILDSGICTRCDTRFHSYRRDAGRAGRNLAIASIS